ncbi:MAG: major capsid protein [Armatimonadetes bacterium]|nr:major capsid protein [Armatimonadota bacterium]MDE2206287.1 major capsid protein [Armatimonadota bacterium]
MPDFVYPTSAELETIAQDYMPRLMEERPIFNILPVRAVDAHLLMWEQMDNYQGLQQVRGLDGDATRVRKTGIKRYLMQPGVYGEFDNIDEQELTARRAMGSFGGPIDISDLVLMAQSKLLQRRLDRIESIGWTLLSEGTFSVPDGTGKVLHTDTFALQSYTAATPWNTAATAAPLADLRAVKLMRRGHSVDLGAGAQAWMNQTTFNNLIMNDNPNDLFGRRTAGLATINNLKDVNTILSGDALPELAVYDAGYFDDSGAFQLYIPNNKVVVVGRRPAGQVVGEYRMTRNANNPNLAPGPYMKVIDTGEFKVPRSLQVHDGHNGGPVIYYPGAIVVMNV